MSVSSLETLPVEILYRILDTIDTETIFISFRYVCKRFYTIINNQNRYKLDFRYISKPNFQQVCHFICPENVIELILSNGNETVGQIDLFLSIFDIHLFTRLTSIILFQINEVQLNTFLNHIIICPIVSLTIEIQDKPILNTTTIDLLSSTIEKLHILRKFKFLVKGFQKKNIKWPVNCTIKHLILNCCTLKQFLTLLQDLPHLQTLVLYDLDTTERLLPSSSKIVSSLKSLSIEQSLIDSNKIQYFLLLTPSLEYLKLTDRPSFDILLYGSCWEEFIKKKLPCLKKFEFFFRIILNEQTIDNLQTILLPYQTFFWLQDKSWYVTCDYRIDTSTFYLYSIPICERKFILGSKISCSTLNENNINTSFILDNISHLHVNFIPPMISTQLNIQYFYNVRELTLYVTDNWPENSVEYLSNTMDLSRLFKLSLNSDPNENSVRNATILIINLMKRAQNLQSLVISYPLSFNIEWIYSKISNKVKHLEIDLPGTENCTEEDFISLLHLSSITLKCCKSYKDYILFFERANCTFHKTHASISAWLGQKHYKKLCKTEHDTKRVKLTHPESFS